MARNTVEELERALCALLAVQERQRRDLAAGRLDTLWQWRGEMEQALRHVRRALAAAGADPPPEGPLRRRLLSLLARAAEGAQDLARDAAQAKAAVQERLAGLRRGRRCLQRYGGQPAAGRPPGRHLHATT